MHPHPARSDIAAAAEELAQAHDILQDVLGASTPEAQIELAAELAEVVGRTRDLAHSVVADLRRGSPEFRAWWRIVEQLRAAHWGLQGVRREGHCGS